MNFFKRRTSRKSNDPALHQIETDNAGDVQVQIDRLRIQIKQLELERFNLLRLMRKGKQIETLQVTGYLSPVFSTRELQGIRLLIKVYIPSEYSYSVASAFLLFQENMVIMEDLSVLRDYQRKNIGSTLFQKVLKETVNAGKSKIGGTLVLSEPELIPIRGFFSKQGILITSTENLPDEQRIKICFEKLLQ